MFQSVSVVSIGGSSRPATKPIFLPYFMSCLLLLYSSPACLANSPYILSPSLLFYGACRVVIACKVIWNLKLDVSNCRSCSDHSQTRFQLENVTLSYHGVRSTYGWEFSARIDKPGFWNPSPFVLWHLYSHHEASTTGTKVTSPLIIMDRCWASF